MFTQVTRLTRAVGRFVRHEVTSLRLELHYSSNVIR